MACKDICLNEDSNETFNTLNDASEIDSQISESAIDVTSGDEFVSTLLPSPTQLLHSDNIQNEKQCCNEGKIVSNEDESSNNNPEKNNSEDPNDKPEKNVVLNNNLLLQATLPHNLKSFENSEVVSESTEDESAKTSSDCEMAIEDELEDKEDIGDIHDKLSWQTLHQDKNQSDICDTNIEDLIHEGGIHICRQDKQGNFLFHENEALILSNQTDAFICDNSNKYTNEENIIKDGLNSENTESKKTDNIETDQTDIDSKGKFDSENDSCDSHLIDQKDDSDIRPTLTEKIFLEEISDCDIDETDFTDILTLNSPVLRRSKNKDGNSQESIFNLEENEENKYTSIRDSLDIVKHQKLISESCDKNINICDLNLNNNVAKEIEECDKISELDFANSVLFKKKKKKVSLGNNPARRVSFPEDDSSLVTSYLEPVNPWYYMSDVSNEAIAKAYEASCNRHNCRSLQQVMQQIAALPVDIGSRIERLSLRNHKLDACQIECLEEIFRRVQFKTLDFEECGLDDESAIPLFDMIEFYDSTTHINIASNTKISSRGWQACARMLKRTPTVKILDAHNTNLNEKNMPELCRALKGGSSLHTLHLENCNLTGRPFINLAGALRLNETISHLYLADNHLGTNDCIQLGNVIRWNKVLTLLDLRNNNIQDAGCAHICKDMIEQQKSYITSGTKNGLTTLNLWNNYLTVNCIPHFCSMLLANHSLETLNLGRNYLTSDGILLLKNALMSNRSIIRLGLQATRVGNEGAVALAEYIADNPVIERIDLRENSIQVAGLLALATSLRISSNVIQLDLDINSRLEPTAELSDQHICLQQEIKALCNKNLTNMHTKEKSNNQEFEEPNKINEPQFRKVSLTCETSVANVLHLGLSTGETRRYRSPEPSPSASPCPSPSLSPSLSPVPSPLKNRFKVFKVSEENIPALDTVSNCNNLSVSTAATIFNAMSSSLPSLSLSTNPNRFLAGRRFTVTKVTDITEPFTSSLPANKTMSSPSLNIIEPTVTEPTIVVSSPTKVVKGFFVDNSTNTEEDGSCQKERSKSLDFGVLQSITTNLTSDDVFHSAETPGKVKRRHGTYQSPFSAPLKAPLASIETGSFDSDSEDSEITTQSSDSTHSDEVRISSTDDITPKVAWDTKKCEEIEES